MSEKPELPDSLYDLSKRETTDARERVSIIAEVRLHLDDMLHAAEDPHASLQAVLTSVDLDRLSEDVLRTLVLVSKRVLDKNDPDYFEFLIKSATKYRTLNPTEDGGRIIERVWGKRVASVLA